MKAKPAFISLPWAWLNLALLVSCESTPAPAPPPRKAADPPKILNFYASPPVIAKGEESLICYGTENIAEVKLTPPVESLKPSYTRCFNVKPEATTEYKMTGIGAGGETTQSLTITVSGVKKPAQAQLIRFFVSDIKETSAPARVTLCYGVMNAVSVKITPGQSVPPSERNCLVQTINQTTTFKLEARSANGAMDTEAVTVKIK